jgi:hypothetical protein
MKELPEAPAEEEPTFDRERAYNCLHSRRGSEELGRPTSRSPDSQLL